MTGILVLTLLWLLWCAAHSCLIAVSVTEFLQRRLGTAYRFYRLGYNTFALATFFPLWHYSHSFTGPTLFCWEGTLSIVRWLLLGLGVTLVVLGVFCYDLFQLTGLRQIGAAPSHPAALHNDLLRVRGIQHAVRHPWYLAAILLVWSLRPSLNGEELLTRIILSGYLVVGTILEERKLTREFGDAYRDYQQQVPMLIPWKWLLRTTDRSKSQSSASTHNEREE